LKSLTKRAAPQISSEVAREPLARAAQPSLSPAFKGIPLPLTPLTSRHHLLQLVSFLPPHLEKSHPQSNETPREHLVHEGPPLPPPALALTVTSFATP